MSSEGFEAVLIVNDKIFRTSINLYKLEPAFLMSVDALQFVKVLKVFCSQGASK